MFPAAAPTRISTRATLSLNRMEMKLASSASPIHTVAIPQPISMTMRLQLPRRRFRFARACPVLLRHEGDQVHALRSQPAGVDRHLIAQRVRPVHAEEALVELSSLQVGLFDQRPRRILGQPAMLHHPPETNLCVRDQTDVKRPRVILQEPATAAADEDAHLPGPQAPS